MSTPHASSPNSSPDLGGEIRPGGLRALTDISDLSDGEIREILGRTADFGVSPGEADPAMDGVVLNLFFEPSTRTRASFEMAAMRCGLGAMHFGWEGSSGSKGETLVDTVRTLDAMAPDVIVVRHASSGAAGFLAEHVEARVVNAGDGCRAHPTQALLDAATLRARLGRIEGLTVSIVGDIVHSRVARSTLQVLTRLGAGVRLVGPPSFAPRELEGLGCEVCHSLEEGIEGADVVYVLRVQRERLGGGAGLSNGEYARRFGVTEERLRLAGPDAVVMHPGPANRGVEATDAVLDGPRSLMGDQVAWGVPTRMAVLEWALEEAES